MKTEPKYFECTKYREKMEEVKGWCSKKICDGFEPCGNGCKFHKKENGKKEK